MAIIKLESSRDFFRIWFFWQKQASFVFFLIVGLVMFYAYTVTPLYQSNAEILVLPRTNEGQIISAGTDEKAVVNVKIKDVYNEAELIASDAVLRDTVQSFGTDGVQLSNESKSFLEIILSPFKAVSTATLRFLRLTSPPSSPLQTEISSLKGLLSIEPIVDSDIILVSLKGERADRTTKVLQTLIKSYQKHRNAVYTKKEGLQFYDDQAISYKEKLDDAESKLKAFEKEANIVNLTIQNQANSDLLTQLRNSLKLLEISYEAENGKITILNENINDEPDILHLTKAMRDIPAIVELQKGIVPILIKRSEISKSFTINSREYTSINSQVEMLRDEIRREITEANRTDELELSSMRIKIETLRDKISALENAASELNQSEKMHEDLVRQVSLYKTSYLLYSAKTEDAKIYAQKSSRDLANVSVSSQPTLPEQPISPHRLMLLFVSIFFGAFSAVCIPFILESIDNKLKTIDDIELILELPVIGVFSEIN